MWTLGFKDYVAKMGQWGCFRMIEGVNSPITVGGYRFFSS